MLVHGLLATHSWSPDQCADYLCSWPGAETWTRDDVLALAALPHS